MSKHTPGPWVVGSEGGYIETANAWRMSIAVCYSIKSKADGVTTTEMQANAQLIAAAPDLLEALKELRKRLIKCSADPISAAEAYDSFYQDIVLSAIDKAEGKA